MAKLTERQRINLSMELQQLQKTIAADMSRFSGELENKYLPEWDDYTFDEKLAQERVKWLKRFDMKLKQQHREFWSLFFKRDMGKK